MSTATSVPCHRGLAFVVGLSLLLSAMVPLVAPTPARAASEGIVISQVYGGGGNSGATYTHDFIELFNRGSEAVDVTGWSVQYASSAGTSWQVTELSGTIQPGAYYLVREGQGTGGTTALPTPDATGSIPMSATAGKVALSPASASLSGTCPLGAAVIDFVGFGAANCFEGAGPTSPTNNTTAALRAGGGCTETDDNAADFSIGAPTPRNSASSANLCDPTLPTSPSGAGTAMPLEVLPGETTLLSVTVTPGTNPESTGIVVRADLTGIGGSDSQPFTSSDGVTFTFSALVSEDANAGLVSLPVGITDAQERTGSATIDLIVQSEATGNVVISQVYGGGGNSGATYSHDFIELYNRTDEAISLAGWSVQYASATGSSWQVTALDGSVEPGAHYLVQLATNNATVGTPLPTPDATGSMNLSGTAGKVALTSGTAPLAGSCPTSATYVDFVGYGSTAGCFEGSGRAPAPSNTTAIFRMDGGAQDTNDNAADFQTGAPSPRNSGGISEPPEGGCGNATHFIHDVQGSGSATPLLGQALTIEGVVVGDYQGNSPALGGFFVQSRDEDADGDPLTSEGIFVFSRGFGEAVGVGDIVSVTGIATEFVATTSGVTTSLTQIASVQDIEVCGSGASVTPATIELPVEEVADWERWEGMLARFTQTMTVTENFSLGRFGELVLSSQGRQYQGTHLADTGAAAAAVADLNARTRIVLDDANTSQNMDPTRYPTGGLSAENTLRIGATTEGLTTVVHEAFGSYRLQPIGGITFDGAADRPMTPPDVGGRIQVAAFNVLNYFNGDGMGGGYPTARGAESQFEFDRQHDKIVAAIAAMDAEVVGLMEIENDGDAAVPAIQTLVDGLNAATAPGTYAWIDTGVIGTDEIAVAIIYQPGEVETLGGHAILDSSVDPAFDDAENRPVLAQSFTETATGATFTVAVNHLKSKGSDCGGAPNDVSEAEGGNCNGTRTEAAAALARWMASDPTGSGDLDALIIGDLNSYANEDPIDQLLAAGYTDLLDAFVGSSAYTYVFQGASGYLDYALSSETMTPQVTGTDAWHINTDEPPVLDYNVNFKSVTHVTELYAPDPFRSSDHDPVIVGLDLLAYGFGGFERPIDDENVARAGSTIPVKFGLDGAFGLDILHEAQVYACGGWPFGEHDDAASSGDAGLRYDPADEQYVFSWKTDRGWAGECKMLVLTLADGTYVSAEFSFR